MRICLVSRELYPYVGGGIAPIVTAAARRLSEIAEVVVVTSAAHRQRHKQLVEAHDQRLLPPDVQVLWAAEPASGGVGAAYTHMHAYSAAVHRVLKDHYGADGPDVLEFADYLAEGFVTVQDCHTAASWLRNTCVCVRLHTTAEICAVLDGRVADDFGTKALLDMERYCLSHADRLLWSGGDVLATYERYYGDGQLAPGVRIRDAFLQAHDPVAATDPRTPLAGTDRHVRLLFAGRLERRKGIQNLFRALDRLGTRGDWSLTVLGADTPTGPTGTSMRDVLSLGFERDERVSFAQPVPRAEVPALIQHHDVVVIPSLWECWPNVGREALMLGRPLLVTPVGGLVDMAVPGRSGWVAAGTRVSDLVSSLETVLDSREAIDRLIASGTPRDVFRELTDHEELLDAYRALPTSKPRASSASGPPGDRRVSVVVPYFRLQRHLEETLRSVEEQAYQDIEVVLVNDGSLRQDDEVVLRLAEAGRLKVLTQPNSGLGQARNAGVRASTGAFVLPLDADDTIAPDFVERCVHALAAQPDLAYVTSWAQFMDEDSQPFGDELGGYMPFGNWSTLIHRNNVGGTCSAVFRREVFDRGFAYSPDLVSYEDWMLFWQMHDAGLTGAVIPERLFNYRVRTHSMTRRDGSALMTAIHDELRARALEEAMTWTA